jgi:hypothetical protein
MAGCSMGRAAGDGGEALSAVEPLLRAFPLRLTLVSPPRTGSTLLARILWEHPGVTHHCHEPFEAQYWGNAGPESCVKVLSNPLEIASATRSALDSIKGRGLLLKEMTFQINRSQFLFLARLANKPVTFVVRDPRLATTSRLRILKELRGAATFPPLESGWPSLAGHVAACREESVPYVIVDSHLLRVEPKRTLLALGAHLGIDFDGSMLSWRKRPDLQLCEPEVGTLMGEGRAHDDPFYRRVLGSSGVQPPDPVDWAMEEREIGSAGLTDHVREWADIYRAMREDSNFVAARD